MKIDITRKQGDFLIDASFTGAGSGVTALYGPSGAGKTSVINMVAGLMSPDKGHISVNGLHLFDSEQGINLPPELRRIGYVFQDGRLLPHLSVRGNLTYGLRLTPEKRRFVTFDSVVELLGIEHLLKRRPAGLSGGEKQRVAIGRALLTSPEMLLMDEPLASLDPRRKAEVQPFIMRLCREFKIPILYVSHVMYEILNLADHLVIMDMGRVVASGNPEDLLSRPDLKGHFGRSELSSVILGTIEEHDSDSGLTRLGFDNHNLLVPPVDAPKGTPIRVHISARHVAIAVKKPVETSFQNIFCCKVKKIVHDEGPFVNVQVETGNLWARITQKSCKDLDIHEGREVFAMVKTSTVSLGASVESLK